MPQGGSPERASAEDLTILARAALVGSSSDRDRLLVTCRQYAFDAAIRLRRQPQGAEDSAQEAAMAVWDLLKRNTLRPETVGGFIGTLVLRNTYAAAQRRAREEDALVQMAGAREAPDPAVAVETAEWARVVRDVADSLPQLLRRLIDLRYGDELSTREIARVVGESKTSVARLLADAETAIREKLRGLIDVDGDDGSDRPPCQRSRA